MLGTCGQSPANWSNPDSPLLRSPSGDQAVALFRTHLDSFEFYTFKNKAIKQLETNNRRKSTSPKTAKDYSVASLIQGWQQGKWAVTTAPSLGEWLQAELQMSSTQMAKKLLLPPSTVWPENAQLWDRRK